jgi:outer membrane protein OmpA-like peptidoglycan-associated protein
MFARAPTRPRRARTIIAVTRDQSRQQLTATDRKPIMDAAPRAYRASFAAHGRSVVAFLEQFPDRTATIEGFSDDSGTDESEQIRPQRRAGSVMSYLIRRGIDPNRLMAIGMGDSWPVANNDSAAGRHQNRRVEFTVHATGVRLR